MERLTLDVAWFIGLLVILNILNVLDVVTTTTAINTYGTSVEMNPVMRASFETNGIVKTNAIKTVICLFGSLGLLFFYVRTGTNKLVSLLYHSGIAYTSGYFTFIIINNLNSIGWSFMT